MIRRVVAGLVVVLLHIVPADAQTGEWTGFYIGANAGFSWGEADEDLSETETIRERIFQDFGTPGEMLISEVIVSSLTTENSGSADLVGPLGGAQAGFNWQAGSFLFGIESDLQVTGQDGRLQICPAPCGPGDSLFASDYGIDWFGTLRGRAGFVVGKRALLYGTGGLAYGHVNADIAAGTVGGILTLTDFDDTRLGWSAGAGVELPIGRRWSLKAEYLHIDLGRADLGSTTSLPLIIIVPGPGAGFTTVFDGTVTTERSVELTDEVFRVGLNYRFGGAP
jgi:outer membrane immunogenic protein